MTDRDHMPTGALAVATLLTAAGPSPKAVVHEKNPHGCNRKARRAQASDARRLQRAVRRMPRRREQ